VSFPSSDAVTMNSIAIAERILPEMEFLDNSYIMQIVSVTATGEIRARKVCSKVLPNLSTVRCVDSSLTTFTDAAYVLKKINEMLG
jgi:hypothetical protein